MSCEPTVQFDIQPFALIASISTYSIPRYIGREFVFKAFKMHSFTLLLACALLAGTGAWVIDVVHNSTDEFNSTTFASASAFNVTAAASNVTAAASNVAAAASNITSGDSDFPEEATSNFTMDVFEIELPSNSTTTNSQLPSNSTVEAAPSASNLTSADEVLRRRL